MKKTVTVYDVRSPDGRLHMSTLRKDEAIRHAQGVFRSEHVTPEISAYDGTPVDQGLVGERREQAERLAKLN